MIQREVGGLMEIEISELRKLEPGGIYVIRTDHELSPGYAEALHSNMDQISKELGIKFLMIGSDMQLLDAEDARPVLEQAIRQYHIDYACEVGTGFFSKVFPGATVHITATPEEIEHAIVTGMANAIG